MTDTMNMSEVRLATPEQSDPEGDNFEDAPDAVQHSSPGMSRQRSSASASTRSLTGPSSNSAQQSPQRNSSGASRPASSSTSGAEPPRSVPAKQEEQEEEGEGDEARTPKPKSVAERMAAFQANANKQVPKQVKVPPEKKKKAKERPQPVQELPKPEAAAAAETADDAEEKTPRPHLGQTEAARVENVPVPASTQPPEAELGAAEPDAEATEDVPLATPKPPKRQSGAFQEVELSTTEAKGEPVEQEAHEQRGRQLSVDTAQSPKSLDSGHSRSTSRVPSISEKVASATSASGFSFAGWGATKKNEPEASMAAKKMSGPWGWLSRKKTATEISPPQPPVPARSSSGSTRAELRLARIDTEPIPAKDQLRERFKMVRMKEEAGINPDQIGATPRSSVASGPIESNEIGSARSSGTAGDIGSPVSTASVSEKAETPASEAFKRGHRPRTASLAQSISVDPSLAPGTVVGINHGPSIMADPEVPVDWDLWQNVVYEGPSAVAKTSPAELNKAIASGIPNPIRGVVWQVLAGSKSEELEQKYHQLILKGTEKEPVTSPTNTNPPLSAKSLASNEPGKEAVASSASSVHSEASGVASPAANPLGESEADLAKKKKDEQATIKKLEKTIRKDLGARSNYSKYFAAKEMQDDLFGVCKAYALYDPAVGYAQGMNFIVMPLLFNMPAEEAFCLLVSLMNHYKLRDTFTQEMPGLHKQLYQFEHILEETNTKLVRHLSRRGISPSLFATQWFLTLFAYKFPLQLVLRVYDLVLSEGLESAVLKFAVALMQKNEEKLLEIQDMAQLKTFLNERLFDVYIDSAPSSHSILEQGFFGSSGGSEKDVYRADLLVQDACAVIISTETLKEYGDEYEAKTKAEKDRQAELEDLRASIAAQSIQIRSLEERVEKSDTEHVQITQEMIKSRMENEDLKTASTDQQGEIENLKKELEQAPEKVETSLKEEMERIMARNTEVQSQNRMLEEQMADMEKNLVETKMQFAQINGDYETLKQKWHDLRRALDG